MFTVEFSATFRFLSLRMKMKLLVKMGIGWYYIFRRKKFSFRKIGEGNYYQKSPYIRNRGLAADCTLEV